MAMENNKKNSIKQIANNKKAYHDYFILEKFECGIELFGTEVKSIRSGSCSIKESFLHKKEILKIELELKNQGITLIPLSVYFKGSKVKLEIGLCKGKKLYDKRETSKKKEMDKKADYASKKLIKNK